MKESVEQVFHEGNFNLFHAIDEDYTINFQCHNFIEVYLSLSGGKHFIIGDTVYNMQRGDLFVCNDLEVHRIITQQGVLYERYWWEFIPSFAYGFCTEQTNLLHYVYERTPDFSHRVSLNPTQLEEILYLIYRYEALSQPDSRKIYGSDVQLDLLRVEMLLFFAKAFHTPSAREIRPPRLSTTTPYIASCTISGKISRRA